MKEVNFLDVTLDLRNGLYRPYMKPDDIPQYVHKLSNHPPSIISNIPAGINKRLSTLSANESIINQAVPPYQEALQKSGYDYKLKFEASPNQSPPKKKRQRRRQVTWFNPPFSHNVKTPIGSKFLRLLDYHIPKGHPLHPIINRNTVKISYRCLPNMAKIISKHNSKLLKNSQPIENNPQNKSRLSP